ncbi:MAG: hypothetical protein ACQEVA_08110 [Myxococcota bacterium]
MKRLSYVLVVFLAAGAFVGCGPDDENNGNNDNNQTDTGVEADADAGTDTETETDTGTDADVSDFEGVTEEEPNNEFAEGTAFSPGDSLAGNIAAGSGETSDLDYFTFTGTAGTVVEFGFASTGAGFEADGTNNAVMFLTDEAGSISRVLAAVEGDSRQAFIPADGNYALVVADERGLGEEAIDNGGPDATYEVFTSETDLTTTDVDLGTAQSDDLNDGAVDGYAFTADSDGLYEAEVVAGRDPVGSSLDSVLYIWDADAGAVVKVNDDIDAQNQNFDSLARFQADSGTNYVAVVDAYSYTADAAYEFTVSESDLDDAPDARRDLSAGDTVSDEISDRGQDDFDTDYFNITLQPGDTVRIAATATDADLQPHVAVLVNTAFGQFPVAIGRPVDGAAAVEFAHPASAEDPQTYAVNIDDLRNVPEDENDTPENVGGSTFGYDLEASDITWTTASATLPLSESGSIADVGNTAFYEFDVTADTMLAYDVETSATDFEPVFGFLSDGTFGAAGAAGAVLYSADETVVAGVRDSFFRGGTGYDFTANATSLTIPDTFTDVTESEGNDDIANANDVTGDLPVAFGGTIENATASDLQPDYVQVTLSSGDTLGAFTEGDGDGDADNNADTVLRLVDSNGDEILSNDDYPNQPQGEYFSALATTVDADGDYYLVVEPYCGESGECSGVGNYTLKAFVE